MKNILLYILIMFHGHLFAEEYLVNKIIEMNVDSSINPATLNYLKTGFEQAKNAEKGLVLIRLNTPGGLITTTKDIITAIGSLSVPVVIWITPEGASATSAGAIISSAAHFIFMSKGTNIGAATPIQMGKDIPEDARNKAINDLVALTQSLSEAKGRDGLAFKDIIAKGASLKASEAVKQKLINGIVSNRDELVSYLNGKTFDLAGTQMTLNISTSTPSKTYEMDLGQRILNMLADPSLAYILFLIGAALIYFELQAPGGFLAGAIGAVFIVLAGIGFQILPLNFGAFGLLVLSFILFILEVYITSFGLLSIAGMVALTIGSLFLYRSDNGYIELKSSLVYSVLFAIGSFLALMTFIILKDLKKGKKEFFHHKGKTGVVIESLPADEKHKDGVEYHVYKVKVAGEIWRACSEHHINPGDQIEVLEKMPERLEFLVKKLD